MTPYWRTRNALHANTLTDLDLPHPPPSIRPSLAPISRPSFGDAPLLNTLHASCGPLLLRVLVVLPPLDLPFGLLCSTVVFMSTGGIDQPVVDSYVPPHLRSKNRAASKANRDSQTGGSAHAPTEMEIGWIAPDAGQAVGRAESVKLAEGSGPPSWWEPDWREQLLAKGIISTGCDHRTSRLLPTWQAGFGWHLPCQPPPGSKRHPIVPTGTPRYDSSTWMCPKCKSPDHQLTHRCYQRNHCWIDYMLTRCVMCGYQRQMLCSDAPVAEVPPVASRKNRRGLW